MYFLPVYLHVTNRTHPRMWYMAYLLHGIYVVWMRSVWLKNRFQHSVLVYFVFRGDTNANVVKFTTTHIITLTTSHLLAISLVCSWSICLVGIPMRSELKKGWNLTINRDIRIESTSSVTCT